MNSDLSYCLRVLSALGPLFAATATLLVGLMVAAVAYRQWRTANDKMVLDLFDRRLDIYSKLESFAIQVEAHGELSQQNKMEMTDTFLRSKFLFGSDVFGRINIFHKAAKSYRAVPAEVLMYESEIERRQAMQAANNAALAEVKGFRKDMPNLFENYLRMHHKLI